MATKGIHQYTVQEGVNAQLGQCRSVYLDSTGAFTPATGEAIIAITVIQDAKFTLLTSEKSDFCIGTDGTDGAYAGVTPGDVIQSSAAFIAGIVLNGRWKALTLASGIVVLHVAQ